MATIEYIIDAVNNASKTFNDIANAAARMDATISASQAAIDRTNRQLAILQTVAAGAAEAIDELAVAEKVLQAANASVAAGLIETARNAGYLRATFGVISTQMTSMLASDAQLTAMNQRLADSFGNIRTQAASAMLSEAALAAMNEKLAASFNPPAHIDTTPFFSGPISAEAHNYWATAAAGWFRVGDQEFAAAAKNFSPLGAGAGGGGGGGGAAAAAAGGFAGGRGGRGFGFGRFGIGLFGLHNIMVFLGAQIIADTVGMIAFGVAATNTLSDVFQAQATLQTSYQTLDSVQKVAALSLNSFTQSLSHSNETGIVTVFKEGLALLSMEMGHAGGVTQQATQAFMQFGGMLKADLSSAGFKSVFGGVSGNIRTDMTALFGLINGLINLIPVVVKDFNGLGLAVVHGVTGAINFVGKLGTALGGVTLKAAALGLTFFKGFSWLDSKLNLLGKLGNLAGVGGRAGVGISAGQLGLGVGALAAEFYWLSRLQSPAQVMNNLMQQQAGFNVNTAASWYKAAAAMQAWSVQQSKIFAGVRGPGGSLPLGSLPGVGPATTPGGRLPMGRLGAVQNMGQANAAAGFALRAQDAAMARTVAANMAYLAQTYGMTAHQAALAAAATGINLTQALTGNSAAAVKDRFIMQQYVATVQGAASPTAALAVDMMLLKQDSGNLAKQVQDLSAAFSQQLAPFANTVQMTVTLKQGNLALVQALKQSHNQVGYNTVAQQASASALSAAITNTLNLSSAVLQQTGSYKKSMGPLQQEISFLESLHSKSTLVTTAIHLLENAINALKSKSITITVNEVAHLIGPFAASGFRGAPISAVSLGGHGPGHPLLASGGMIHGGIPGRDSVLGMLMPGEVVVPTRMVKAGAVDHLRGSLPGFDRGGWVMPGGTGIAGNGRGGWSDGRVTGPYVGYGGGPSIEQLLQQIYAELERIRLESPTNTGAATAKSLNSLAGPARQGGFYNSRSAHG